MKILLAVIAMIFCTVIANILMKMGAIEMGEGADNVLLRLFSWKVIIGLFFFATSAVIYLVILSWIPLSVAQSFAAAQFVAVILASSLVLSEKINIIQLQGMTLILIGIVIVGLGNRLNS